VSTPSAPPPSDAIASGAAAPALPAGAAPEHAPPEHVALPRASTSLRILAALAIAYTLWAAQELFLPILLAMFFALVGNPIIRLLQKLWIPRALGAVLLVAAGIAGVVLLGRQLVEPAATWVQQVPREIRQLAPKLQKMVKPVTDANKAAENIARAAEGGRRNVQVVRTELNDPYRSLTATPKLLASVLAVVLLTLFFMIFGQRLQHAAIALLPSRQQKRLTVDILQSIELETSRYVLTITLINTVVGVVFAGLLHWICDLPLQEALLWGTVAAMLNFAPYVGPLIGMVLMLMMGFVEFDYPLPSLTPAALYLGLHTIEGQIVTPLILGKRMALSPLVLMLGLMVFGWAWGIIGLLLAVPLLVCVKIVLAKIEGLEGWAKVLE
jgi:predicted PurR-regulated permease PerM